MKSICYYGLIIFTIFLFTNCKKDKNPVISNDDISGFSFFPLQIGNQWIYNEQFPQTETIVNEAIFNGTTYYNIEGSHILQPDFWITEKDHALYFLNTEDTSEHLLFDFAANYGDSWAMPDGFECVFGDSITFMSDTVTVYALNDTFYNCYHFQYKKVCNDGGLLDTWIAKRIGIVKVSKTLGLDIMIIYWVVTQLKMV